MNLTFGISFGIISVVKATDLYAEGHFLYSCILHHINIGMNIYPDLFPKIRGRPWLSMLYSDYKPFLIKINSMFPIAALAWKEEMWAKGNGDKLMVYSKWLY